MLEEHSEDVFLGIGGRDSWEGAARGGLGTAGGTGWRGGAVANNAAGAGDDGTADPGTKVLRRGWSRFLRVQATRCWRQGGVMYEVLLVRMAAVECSRMPHMCMASVVPKPVVPMAPVQAP